MDSEKNSILVPVDFSEQSIIAVGQSYNLARFTNSDIVLLTVVGEQNALQKLLAKPKDGDFEEKVDRIKEHQEEIIKKIADESGIHAVGRIEKGYVQDQILKVAEEIKPVCIIMGTEAINDFKHRFLGSTALRVARESQYPVITIKGKHHRNGCENIVLPLDLTKETKEKVKKALEFARYFDAVINLVTVVDSHDDFLLRRLKRQQVQVQEAIQKSGVKCTVDFVEIKKEKSIAQLILTYAKEKDADLIMIMTQHENPITDFLMGSSAQEIIFKSEIPVFSITPMKRKDTSQMVTPY